MQSSSVCSDSETSTISQGSFIGKKTKQPATQCKDRMTSDTFAVDNPYKYKEQNHQGRPRGEDSEYYNEEELWRLMDVDESIGATDRPSHLDISACSGGYTPVVSRKPMFQLSGKNSFIPSFCFLSQVYDR